MGLQSYDSSSTSADGTKKWGEKVRMPTYLLPAPSQATLPFACAQFKWYLLIEGGIWLPACYFCCYRFQPTMRFMASPTGRALVMRSSTFLERWAPSWRASIAKLASKIEGAPATRAFGEWALINKILAPIGFPTKMWIAHKIVERRRALVSDT